MSYKLLKKENKARRGEFSTVHGTVQTPCFMNVATVAATIAAKTIAAPAEQEQNYDPRPFIAEHTVVVSVVVTANCGDVGGCHSVGSQTLVDFSFENLFYVKAIPDWLKHHLKAPLPTI